EHMEKLSLKRNIFLDALTGVFNRKYLTELGSLLEGKGLAVLMVDVDFFKKVNDTYGHDVGDLVLKAIAKVCRSSVRNDDKVIRYGGEEFLIIIPTSDDTLAFKIAERIRRNVEMREIKIPNGEIIRKTVSIGGTIMRSNEELEDAIKRADKALYDAKRMGRNIVVFV
ncbi:MAG TPA: GGDEF domain-containing protein, partial [Thermotogales bacterium]|nr:GGDEF domain-containing protein [Thermotogales bacterium]